MMAEDESKKRRNKNQRGIAELWRGYGPAICRNLFPQLQVLTLALGRNHGLLLTSENRVYSFGSGKTDASLGLGSQIAQISEPSPIDSFDEICIVEVFCGPEHSGAISDVGELFMWGDNSYGQCGQLPENKSIAYPAKVDIHEHVHNCPVQNSLVWEDVEIMQASSGEQHTLAVAKNGELWTWGTGVQVGIPGNSTGFVAQCKLVNLVNYRVLSAVCGLNYSLAIVTSNTQHSATSREFVRDSSSGCKICDQIMQTSKKDIKENVSRCPLGLPIDAQNEEASVKKISEHCSNLKHPERTKEQKNAANGRSQSAQLLPDFSTGSQVHNMEDVCERPTVELSAVLESETTLPPNAGDASLPSFEIVDPQTLAANVAQVGELSPSGEVIQFTEEPVKFALNTRTVKHFLTKRFMNEPELPFANETNVEQTPTAINCSLQSASSVSKFTFDEFSFVSKYGWNPSTAHSDSLNDLELFPSSSSTIEAHNRSLDISDCCDSYSLHTTQDSSADECLHFNGVRESKVSSCERVDSLHDPVDFVFDHGMGTAIHDNWHDKNSELCWQTEVWSWGKNTFGQLGHGDSLDRDYPVCIKILNNTGVVKVVAGDAHNLAVTVSGQVYAWGSDSHGQLAAKDESEHLIYFPQPIKMSDKAFVWDLAASSKGSLILVNRSGEQGIHFCGKQEGSMEKAESMKTESWMPHRIHTQDCKIRQVFAGGPFNGCIVDQLSSGHLCTLYELAISELQFFKFLDNLVNSVLEPILQNETFACGCGTSVQLLFRSYLAIAKNSAQNGHRLRYLIQHPNAESTLPLFHDVEHQLSIYQKYCAFFCDALAINGFERCIKVAHSIFKAAAHNLKSFISEEITSDVISPEILQHLLEEPIRHMAQYKKLFTNLGQQHKLKDWPSRWELSVAQKWKDCYASIIVQKQESERTRAFWDACPLKIADALKEPSRRILRDNKSCPVHLLNAGRFSSHWFMLFNDALVHSQYAGLTVYDLAIVWVDPAPDLIGNGNAFSVTLPEETLTLVCDSTHAKTEWVCALNDAINAKLKTCRGNCSLANSNVKKQASIRRSPPLRRNSTYTFTKLLAYKDAKYLGMWFNGQMHGHGEITWSDGSKYVGCFRQNKQDGYGTHSSKKLAEEKVSEGIWKNGKLNGLGSIRYPNGDLYEGYFKDGLRDGHGVLKRGHLTLSSSSIYIGQWVDDKRQGYGVMDDIGKGEKYMGMWLDDSRHGKGMLVTLDGIYFEGNFVKGHIGGFGLMYDNRSWYEGEVGPERTFNGKGLLTLTSGEIIDGNFSGSWNDGIKINGMLTKATQQTKSMEGSYPSSFGTLCVAAEEKWVDIFQQCYQLLGIKGLLSESRKAWEALAILITNWKESFKPTKSKQLQLSVADLSILERIPPEEFQTEPLTIDNYIQIRTYLLKAFDTPYHPLGKLMDGLVDVYRATYVGIGAHPCLLLHAVEEVHSLISRINDLIRILFPRLPANKTELMLDIQEEQTDLDVESCSYGQNVITAEGLLLPIFLPKIYPPLFTLYVLRYEEDDNLYWETLMKWNKQPDLTLMAFLAVDEKFWFVMKDSDSIANKRTPQSMSTIRNCHYANAIDTLQQMSTMFSPLEKLLIVKKVFEEINREVQSAISSSYVWTMDDLFPVFQYVVVRACIRHLGSEIHMIDDLMEKRLQNGELGMMFTMLKASYFQVTNERSLVMNSPS